MTIMSKFSQQIQYFKETESKTILLRDLDMCNIFVT